MIRLPAALRRFAGRPRYTVREISPAEALARSGAGYLASRDTWANTVRVAEPVE